MVSKDLRDLVASKGIRGVYGTDSLTTELADWFVVTTSKLRFQN